MENKDIRIFILCPDNTKPSGGVKQIYRQVDILNKNGFNAFVLHQKYGFRCSWFKNSAKIAYKNDLKKFTLFTAVKHIKEFLINPLFNPFYFLFYISKIIISHKFRDEVWKNLKNYFVQGFIESKSYKNIRFEPKDYLVIPEFYNADFINSMKDVNKVIYNQNAHYSFLHYPLSKETVNVPYLNKDLQSVIVVSEHNSEYLRYAFPDLNLIRFYNGVNSGIFNYSSQKKKQIAFMPRKLQSQVRQLINILKVRNVLEGFDLVEIDNMSEKQTADTLRESIIFLSFSAQEGFGLPPMEAMACGCVVIGYHGYGGQEYFNEDFCYPVNSDDILTFAKTVESVINEYKRDNTSLIEKGKKASDYVLSAYSLEKEERIVVDFWRETLSG